MTSNHSFIQSIRGLSDCTTTRLAMLTVACCLLAMNLLVSTRFGAFRDYVLVINAIVFISWLVWGIWMVSSKRTGIRLGGYARRIFNCAETIIFMLWIISCFVRPGASVATGGIVFTASIFVSCLISLIFNRRLTALTGSRQEPDL